MIQTINIDTGVVLSVALTRAQRLGYISSASGAWVSDAETPGIPDAKVLWEDRRIDSHDLVLEMPNAIIALTREQRNVKVSIASASVGTTDAVMDMLVEQMPPSERQSNLLDVTFWYLSQHGPRSYDRQLAAPSWEAIAGNYPKATRERLTALQGVELKEDSGKLLLWQGEPGTGKTFALRALAEEWADWCRLHYVLDPEKFFMEGDYLLSVILGQDDYRPRSDAAPVWRLIVLEDAGEMLAKDAKLQVGQGLARLLNLCDGLLGQGLRVLVLITTNEQIGSLHAAVSRPGRCLSQISFEKFDAPAIATWLQAHEQPPAAIKTATLADLYAMLRGEERPPKIAAGF